MKNRFVKPFILLLLVSAFGVSIINSCKHDTIAIDKGNSTKDSVYFSDVLPIFVSNCATTDCHDGTGHLFALNSYSSIMEQVQAGSAW